MILNTVEQRLEDLIAKKQSSITNLNAQIIEVDQETETLSTRRARLLTDKKQLEKQVDELTHLTTDTCMESTPYSRVGKERLNLLRSQLPKDLKKPKSYADILCVIEEMAKKFNGSGPWGFTIRDFCAVLNRQADKAAIDRVRAAIYHLQKAKIIQVIDTVPSELGGRTANVYVLSQEV